MIVCLFGVRYRHDYDPALEHDLDERLLPALAEIRGAISFHIYRSDADEVLGVIRFDTRGSLDAWRDDAIHRSAWPLAPALYEHFWIQTAETYREYGWKAAEGRTVEDLRERFRSDPENRISPIADP